MKPLIRIHFTDVWEPFSLHDNIFVKILQKKYEIIFDAVHPQFLFCSCFGHEHTRYSCVKICCLGENVTPDFNIFDYAYGFDRMTFEDRYMRYPLYKLYMSSDDLQEKTPQFFAEESTKKTHFCNFLYSNNRNAATERESFFHLLNKYKTVDSGGGFLNTLGYRVEDTCAWQRQYKFSIAFENSSKHGYVTEKILNALKAHTIPIYWGDPTVTQDFNPQRFINCHDYPSFDAVVDVVRQIDADPDMYQHMLMQPWFVGEKPPLPLDDEQFLQFFDHIIAQGPEKARRVIYHGFTHQYHIYIKCFQILSPLARIILKIQNFLKKIL